MTFTFPNPSVTPEFLGDNGITYAWDSDRWKVKAFKGGTPGREPIFSDTPPTVHPGFQPPDNDLKPGDIWYDTSDDLAPHVWDGTDWQATGNYVQKKGGDFMEGPLEVTGGRDPDGSGIVSTVKALNVDSGQNSALHLKQDGATKVYVGKAELTTTTNVKFNQNNLKVKSDTDKELFTMNSSGVFYEGAYTAEKHIATKKDLDEAIFNDITDDTSHKFVKRSGDTMTGRLNFKGASYIDARNADNLAGRAGLEITCSGDKPLAISNSGSYQETLAIYGYVGDEPGGRGKNLTIGAQGNLWTQGNITSVGTFIKGTELRSTKLTSGQSSNLEIYRGSGAGEERKMLIGTDSVNFDVPIKVDEVQEKSAGNGVVYDGRIQADNHLVNKGYVDGQLDELVTNIGNLGTSKKAGVFTWVQAGALPPGHWQFEGRNDPSYTYNGVTSVIISKSDQAGKPWAVSDFPVGSILRIEDESDDNFLEGEITSAVDMGSGGIQVGYTIIEAKGAADGDQVVMVAENLDHAFVHTVGDRMTGDLTMENSKVNFTNMGANRIAIQARRGQDQDLTLLNLLNNNSQDNNQSWFYNIKLQGNTFYNGLRIKGGSNANTTFWEMRAGSGETTFFSQTKFNNKKLQQVADGTEDSDAATFGQVKSYVADNAPKVEPGDQVVRTDGSTTVELGGFYLSGGNLYVRVS